jgi:hypothetical protein
VPLYVSKIGGGKLEKAISEPSKSQNRKKNTYSSKGFLGVQLVKRNPGHIISNKAN